MKYMKMRQLLKQEYKNRIEKNIKCLDKLTEYNDTKEKVLNYVVRWTLDKRNSYKGTYEEQKQKTIQGLKRKFTKQLNKDLDYLKSIENVNYFKGRLIITVDWKKSYMWGYNPLATDNFNNTSGSIGGCGYCKNSTATSRILNQHLGILKYLFDKKEKALKENPKATNREVLTYGSGYNLMPCFEGGVGVSCHKTILSNFGFKWDEINQSKTTDTHIIEVD